MLRTQRCLHSSASLLGHENLEMTEKSDCTTSFAPTVQDLSLLHGRSEMGPDQPILNTSNLAAESLADEQQVTEQPGCSVRTIQPQEFDNR